jgi:hypothetical protein
MWLEYIALRRPLIITQKKVKGNKAFIHVIACQVLQIQQRRSVIDIDRYL